MIVTASRNVRRELERVPCDHLRFKPIGRRIGDAVGRIEVLVSRQCGAIHSRYLDDEMEAEHLFYWREGR